MRVRCFNDSLFSSKFIGECELKLDSEDFKVDEKEDWRWPDRQESANQNIRWFSLRMDKHNLCAESLDQPLLPTVPGWLHSIAKEMHCLWEHHFEYHRRHTDVDNEVGSAASTRISRTVARISERLGSQQCDAEANGTREKERFDEAGELYTHRSHEHLLISAQQMLRRSHSQDDIAAVRQAEAAIKELGDVASRYDSFSGLGLVRWLQRKYDKSHDEAVDTAKRLLNLEIITRVSHDSSTHYVLVVQEDVLYMFNNLREYLYRGEVALRLGWATQNTLDLDDMRQELSHANTRDLHDRAIAANVSESKLRKALLDSNNDPEKLQSDLIELLVQQRGQASKVWEPFAWQGSVRTARPRHRASIVPVLCFGFITTVFGLAMIFLYAANMSPANTRLWFNSTFWSLILKIAVLDPLRLVIQTAVVQLAESWPVSQRLIEEKLHRDQLRRQATLRKRGHAEETKTDACMRFCLSSCRMRCAA